MTRIRKSWGDTKAQNLEECLGEFVVTVPRVAAAIKFGHEERKRQQQRLWAQETRAEAERIRRAEYGRKVELIGKLGRLLREANLMLEFAGALKQTARSTAVPVERKLSVLPVVVWIERHASSLDPLMDIAALIRRFDKRPN